ncbi:cry18A [Acrasis kona]|uniref:Cry18A n=1 Tax=Acrasis kona TaxID=1008807 RepID=A0AAW2ZMP6_9EUKA
MQQPTSPQYYTSNESEITTEYKALSPLLNNGEWVYFRVSAGICTTITRYLVILLTFGLGAPFVEVNYYRNLSKGWIFNGRRAKFTGTILEMFLVIAINYFLNIITIGMWFSFGFDKFILGKHLDKKIMWDDETKQNGEWKLFSAGSVFLNIRFTLTTVLSFGLLTGYARHQYYRDWVGTVRLGGETFKYTGNSSKAVSLFLTEVLMNFMFPFLACIVRSLVTRAWNKYVDENITPTFNRYSSNLGTTTYDSGAQSYVQNQV